MGFDKFYGLEDYSQKELIMEVKGQRLGIVVPYVINEAWQVKILSHFKADAFITDKPSLILGFLGRLTELTPYD